MTTNTANPAPPVRQQAQRKSLIASITGQTLEWYEWSAYAVFAPFIAQVMFNPENPVSALLSTLAVFAVGFLFRPLGGIVFGYIADRKGRKFVLITTMLTMAAASVVIGLLPTYDTIGVWASVALLLTRIVQGFAHGGESAAANSYVAEIAPPKHRGLYSSFIFVAIFGGSILAYTLGGTITGLSDESFVLQWGWRIPFLLGAVLALVALYMRRGMAESALFEATQATEGENRVQRVDEHAGSYSNDSQAVSNMPATDVTQPARRKKQLKSILLIIGLVAGGTAAHYTWTSYASTYAITAMGMVPQSAYWVTVVAQIIALASLPFWGRLSDRIGRKPILYIFAFGTVIVQFPLRALISDEPWTLLVSSAVALVFTAASGAMMAAIMAETFPTAQRTRLIGLAYSISTAVFGGSAPYLNQLFNSLDIGWMASGYVVILALVTLVVALRLPETKGIDLNTVK